MYFKTDDNKIYKYNREKDYYLLCTPSEKGEDRRKHKSELVNLKPYNTNKATFEINEIWRNTPVKWEFNGKKFEACGWVYEEKHGWNYTKVFELCKPHVWTSVYKNREYHDTYFLVIYHGKLVWIQSSHYFPNLYYYKFEGIDKKPSRMIGWTNIKCVRPVFCVTDKCYI